MSGDQAQALITIVIAVYYLMQTLLVFQCSVLAKMYICVYWQEGHCQFV